MMIPTLAILHHDLEWTEISIARALEDRGIQTKLIDIRNSGTDALGSRDVLLNRVYASVANRDYASIDRTLQLLDVLQKHGVVCINSHSASLADYNKYHAYQMMRSCGVTTPRSRLVQLTSENALLGELSICGQVFGYPFILKRNTGGRGKGLYKVDSEELEITVVKELMGQGYEGTWIAQEYIPNHIGYDCRISVVGEKVVHSYCRTLIKAVEADLEPWLASRCRGSSCFAHIPSESEVSLAIAATKAIGAHINEVDMTFGPHGPVIIENNPTPQYISDLDGDRFPRFIEELTSLASVRALASVVDL